MTVRQLISELLRSGIDMDSEVMISAPLECNRGAPGAGNLTLPTIRVEAGEFPDLSVNQERKGKPWVSICGTDAWGQFQESPLPTKIQTDDLVDAEMARLNEMCSHLRRKKKT